MEGIHLLGEWYGCPADTPEFTQADPLRELCVKAARDAGLTVVGERFFQFEPQGVTGTVLLAESHIAIHTWPEFSFASVDVYTCGTEINPWRAYNFMVKKFKAKNMTAVDMKRGVLPIPAKLLKHKPSPSK